MPSGLPSHAIDAVSFSLISSLISISFLLMVKHLQSTLKISSANESACAVGHNEELPERDSDTSSKY